MSRAPRIFANPDCTHCKGKGQFWASRNGSEGRYVDCGNCHSAYASKLIEESQKGIIAALRRREDDHLARRAEDTIVSLLIRIRQMEADSACARTALANERTGE